MSSSLISDTMKIAVNYIVIDCDFCFYIHGMSTTYGPATGAGLNIKTKKQGQRTKAVGDTHIFNVVNCKMMGLRTRAVGNPLKGAREGSI